MRILVLHNAYAQPGGEDAVVQAEVDGLRARGHHVQLLMRDSKQLHTAPLRGAAETLLTVANVAAGAELGRVLREFRPEVVHIHNLFPRWGLAVLRVLERARVPVVQTLHNFRWLCAPATFLRDGHDCRRCAEGSFLDALRFSCMKQGRLVSAAYALALTTNRVNGLAERVVSRFVCVSEFVRRCYAEAGFARPKLRVNGHFISHAPGPDGPGDGSAIYAGRLSPEKGTAMLARALTHLPGITLKVAGDGSDRQALELIASRGPGRTLFLGRLSREALQAEVRRSSVCVVPSTGSETFGLAALEAFACGRPVVATDSGGLPELVQDGHTGWVVPRGDAEALAMRVRWLLDHPERARSFGRAGLALARGSYSPSARLATLEATYQDALAAPA